MSLKIIMGNMFSGKTTELVRRLKRYDIIGKRIMVVTLIKIQGLHTKSYKHTITLDINV